ncbi:MAG TPA: methylmalonyl Co-A mutase-associated GTPase MeaB, partial [Balneolaceae bacterium]|nr:methylmalonyl Co-A mutase-associated GTPase MeaB [Balneolaceae bacterium]
TLGGVARRTRESMLLCEAAGYDVVLVETVGVGQSEYEVASMVDCFMVLMLPGAGDSLQGIKRGILEITDILVVNKADGSQKQMAKLAISEYKHAFQLLSPKYEGVEVQFRTASALRNEGIEEVWEGVSTFVEALKQKQMLQDLRDKQDVNWFKRLAEEAVVNALWNTPGNKLRSRALIQKIIRKEISPSAAAAQMIEEKNQ